MQIFLAIQATQSPQNLSLQRAAQAYNVPLTTLSHHVRRIQPQASRCNPSHPLTKAKKEELIQHVIDLDLRGFSPQIDHIRDIADQLRTTYSASPVGKH